jgi:hypothetical protein
MLCADHPPFTSADRCTAHVPSQSLRRFAYLPATILVSPGDLTNLISQLQLQFIILGDFNTKTLLFDVVLADERA